MNKYYYISKNNTNYLLLKKKRVIEHFENNFQKIDNKYFSDGSSIIGGYDNYGNISLNDCGKKTLDNNRDGFSFSNSNSITSCRILKENVDYSDSIISDGDNNSYIYISKCYNIC